MKEDNMYFKIQFQKKKRSDGGNRGVRKDQQKNPILTWVEK